MTKQTPSRRAGLVTFAASVSLIGDGNSTVCLDDIHGVGLSAEAVLRKEGAAAGPLLSRPVSQARPELFERLFKLRPRGGTALGPAVVAGLSMREVRGAGRKGGRWEKGERWSFALCAPPSPKRG